jgi:hypothetical protein
MKRLRTWWLFQQLAWKSFFVPSEVMAKTLKLAALEREGASDVSDEDLMRQAFQDKLNGKSNSESAAMRELALRHNL